MHVLCYTPHHKWFMLHVVALSMVDGYQHYASGVENPNLSFNFDKGEILRTHTHCFAVAKIYMPLKNG